MSLAPEPNGFHWESIFTENALIERIIKNLNLSKGSKILDIPCGEGKRTEFISSLGYEVVGIDEDMDKIRQGILVYSGLELYQHDMQDIFYVHYFNLVLLMDYPLVFHRKPNENGYILRNLFSCLAPGGYIVLGIPNNEIETLDEAINMIGEVGDKTGVFQLSLESLPLKLILLKKLKTNMA